MKRREFISLLGGAAAAWPLVARAQQPDRMRRIGVLMNLAERDPEGQARIAAFREGLGKLGWTEGREVQIEYRWFAGDPERAQAYAADLVKLKPEVIFAGTAPSLAPLQRETRSVPIVFAQVADPVGGGLLPAWHGRAAISPDSLNSSMRSVRSGWNCSSRSPYPILGSGLFWGPRTIPALS
jgi:putative tryptophan/tyrosine transport system substrate-binding protein